MEGERIAHVLTFVGRNIGVSELCQKCKDKGEFVLGCLPEIDLHWEAETGICAIMQG